MKPQTNIPMVTKLVASGDPELKARAQANRSNGFLQANELNQRIDELESAIGQDNSGPVGRAFAIRAESTKKRTPNRRAASRTNLKNEDEVS